MAVDILVVAPEQAARLGPDRDCERAAGTVRHIVQHDRTISHVRLQYPSRERQSAVHAAEPETSQTMLITASNT